MKRKVLSFVALLAACFSSSAWGAEPIASWTDFHNLTSNEKTLVLDSACTVNADGSVTLGGAGISLADLTMSDFSLVFEFADVPSDNIGTFVSFKLGSNNVCFTRDATKVYLGYSGSLTNGSYTRDAFTAVMITHNYANGIYAYYTLKDGTSQAFDRTGIKWSDATSVNSFRIGAYDNTGAQVDDDTITKPMAGMTVSAVYLYDTRLTAIPTPTGISINVPYNDAISGTAMSGLVPVANDNWNNLAITVQKVATTFLKANDGSATIATIEATTGNGYFISSETRNTVLGDMGVRYADGPWAITLKDIPYSSYELILYMGTDNNNKTWSSVQITDSANNTTYYSYTGNETTTYATASETEASWGTTADIFNNPGQYGKDVVRIGGLSGDITINTSGTSGDAGTRGGFCGIQIINTGTARATTDIAYAREVEEEIPAGVIVKVDLTTAEAAAGSVAFTVPNDSLPEDLSWALFYDGVMQEVTPTAALDEDGTLTLSFNAINLGFKDVVFGDKTLKAIETAPSADAYFADSTPKVILDGGDYYYATKVTGSSGETNPSIFGGSATSVVNAPVYILVEGGEFSNIHGGGYSEAWQGSPARSMNGDIYVEMTGGTTDWLFGGNWKDGLNPNLTGDIKVVVSDDAVVNGTIGAGGYSTHSGTTTYGTTEKPVELSVVVKNVQSSNTASDQGARKSGYIVGGGIYQTNTDPATQLVNGNTSVTIDLQNDATGSFAKSLVGAGMIAQGGSDHNSPTSKVTGNATVTVNNPAGITFSGNIVGGGYQPGAAADVTVGGNTTVTLNGGTYSGTITAGGIGGQATVAGTATLNLNGGTYSGALNPGQVTGASALNIDGATTIAGTVGEFTTTTLKATATLTATTLDISTWTIEEGAKVAVSENGTLTLGEKRPTLASAASGVTIELTGTTPVALTTTEGFDSTNVTFVLNGLETTLTQAGTTLTVAEKRDNVITTTGTWSTLTASMTDETEIYIDGTEASAESPVTVTFDAAIANTITGIHVLGYVKLVTTETQATIPSCVQMGENTTLTVSASFGTTETQEANRTIAEDATLIIDVGEGSLSLSTVFDVKGSLTTRGTVTLSGANKSTGNITVETGTLTLNAEERQLAGVLTVKSGATFVNSLASDAIPYGGTSTIHVYGTLDLGTTRWTVGNGNAIHLYEGAVVTGEGDNIGALDIYQGSVNIQVHGNAEIAATINRKQADGASFTVADGKTLTITGEMTGGNSYVFAGNGKTILKGENKAYTSATTVNSGATLEIQSVTLATSGVTVADGAAVTFTQDTEKTETAYTYSNTFALTGRMDKEGNHAVTLSGVISGNGALNVKAGSLKLTADNTRGNGAATTIESNAVLEIAKDARLMTTSAYLNASSLTIRGQLITWDWYYGGALGNFAINSDKTSIDGGKVTFSESITSTTDHRGFMVTANGATLEIGEGLTYEISAGSNNDISINANGTLNLTGAGSFKLNKNNLAGTVTVANGTTLIGTAKTFTTLTLDSGAILDATGNAVTSTTATLGETLTVKVASVSAEPVISATTMSGTPTGTIYIGGTVNNNYKLSVADNKLYVVEKDYVTTVNGTSYETLAEAIAASGDTDTITLLKDSYTEDIDLTKAVTLSGTATLSGAISGTGTLTIASGRISLTAKIDTDTKAATQVVVADGAVLELAASAGSSALPSTATVKVAPTGTLELKSGLSFIKIEGTDEGAGKTLVTGAFTLGIGGNIDPDMTTALEVAENTTLTLRAWSSKSLSPTSLVLNAGSKITLDSNSGSDNATVTLNVTSLSGTGALSDEGTGALSLNFTDGATFVPGAQLTNVAVTFAGALNVKVTEVSTEDAILSATTMAAAPTSSAIYVNGAETATADYTLEVKDNALYIVEKVYVAQVTIDGTTTKYEDIAAAITAANGGTVTIIGTVELTMDHINSGVTFVKGQDANITIPEGYEWDGDTLVSKSYVAQVTVGEGDAAVTTKYETLAEAIEKAEAGATVTVIANIDLTETVTISKKVTLNLNGKTLSNTTDLWNNTTKVFALITVVEGGDLTITGEGTVKAKANDCYAVELKAGKATLENGTFNGNLTSVYVQTGELIINGGTYDIQQTHDSANPNQPAYSLVINCTDANYDEGKASITINGGKFKNWNPGCNKAEGPHTHFAPAGKVGQADADGWYTLVDGTYVAQTADACYTSLADAIEAAADGATVTVIANIDLTETVTISKKVTLNLNGKTLSNTKDLWNNTTKVFALITVVDGGDLTITGEGTVKAKANDCYAVELKAGKATLENGTFNGNLTSVYVQTGELIINGGTYDIQQTHDSANPNQPAYSLVINCTDANYDNKTASITINGGKFKNWNPGCNKAEGPHTHFAPAGKVGQADADGWYTLVDGTYVAQTADACYTSLADAIAAAADGATVTVIADVALTAPIDIAKKVTLDLGEYTITPAEGYAKDYLVGIKYGADVTIEAEIDGAINYANNDKVYTAVKMTLTGETYDGSTKATLTVNNGILQGKYYGIAGNGYRHGTVITVAGGTVAGDDGFGIYHPQNGTLTVTGGTVMGYTGIYVKAGTVEIKGGYIEATGAKAAYEYSSSGAEPTGDALVVDNCDYPGQSPTVTISGGTFTVAENGGVQVGAYAGNNVTEIASITNTGNTLTAPDGYEWDTTGKLVAVKKPDLTFPDTVTPGDGDEAGAGHVDLTDAVKAAIAAAELPTGVTNISSIVPGAVADGAVTPTAADAVAATELFDGIVTITADEGTTDDTTDGIATISYAFGITSIELTSATTLKVTAQVSEGVSFKNGVYVKLWQKSVKAAADADPTFVKEVKITIADGATAPSEVVFADVKLTENDTMIYTVTAATTATTTP